MDIKLGLVLKCNGSNCYFFLIEMIIYFYIVKGAFLRLPVRPVGTGGCAVLL